MAFRLVERHRAALPYRASLVERADALRLANGRKPLGDDEWVGGEASLAGQPAAANGRSSRSLRDQTAILPVLEHG